MLMVGRPSLTSLSLPSLVALAIAVLLGTASTSGFKGIIGDITCDRFGDCGTGRVLLVHHTDSSITDVSQLPVLYRFAP